MPSAITGFLGAFLAMAMVTLTPLPGAAGGFGATSARVQLERMWPAYVERFVQSDGRVVDTANGAISHSEGQGYAMLLAVANDDRSTFDAVWVWTRQTLGVREDGLFAWVYDPHAGGVRDPNNATDGDLLIAWALLRAADRWDAPSYRHAARTLCEAILANTIVRSEAYGQMIRPGVAGFSADERTNGAVFNLSYWVFPALADLAPLLGASIAQSLERSGLSLLEDARFGSTNLPPDWLALDGNGVNLAEGFEPVFGYNAIRIPLYLVWGQAGSRGHLAPFMAQWPDAASLARDVALVELASQTVQPLRGNGYEAIAELTSCAMLGVTPARALQGAMDDHYYPATLHLLALLAFQERGLAC